VSPGAACFPSGVRTLAVLAALLVFAAPAAAATATVTWQTTSPTRGQVAYGVGGLYLYSVRESAATTSHSVTLEDLAPSTTYTYRVGGVTSELTTPALPADARFGTDRGRITANGSLFFPVLVYQQCADTLARALALGANMFVQVPFTDCTDPVTTSPPYVLGDDYGASAGGGWYLPDEPDGWNLTPDELPSLPPVAQTGRLRVLNISQHFASFEAIIRPGFDRSTYAKYIEHADVVGFDLYPIVKFCGRVSLIDMFRAQRELIGSYAGGRPTFQWIETSQMTGECPTLEITPAIVNAETWLAVAGGACGIGYFTNSWTGPLWNRWDFDPGVESQIGKTVAEVQQLAPALCDGQYGDVVVPWDGPVAASARTLNGATYVIAVNSSDRQLSVPFRDDVLAGRTLTVLGEGRTIKAVKKLYYRDTFGPYEVHVYVAAP
jgi:hypothetical protein